MADANDPTATVNRMFAAFGHMTSTRCSRRFIRSHAGHMSARIPNRVGQSSRAMRR